MQEYHEDDIRSRLSVLDRHSKTAFAVSCAQRLVPLYGRYARAVGTHQETLKLSAMVDAVWNVVSGVDVDLRSFQAEAESMVPSDVEGWILETGYGQNAAAAAAYAIRTWLTDSPEEAAWAARQVYEIADYAVLQGGFAPSFNHRDLEGRVLATDAVQLALKAIARSLELAESSHVSWLTLREEANADGVLWATLLP